jgi:hypothetical protein
VKGALDANSNAGVGLAATASLANAFMAVTECIMDWYRVSRGLRSRRDWPMVEVYRGWGWQSTRRRVI